MCKTKKHEQVYCQTLVITLTGVIRKQEKRQKAVYTFNI